jgi:hypothetical protein
LLSVAVRADATVIELGVTSESKDVQIAPAMLPQRVMVGLTKGMLGGKIVEASFSNDEGPEYDIIALRGEQRIDITVSPAGQILEVGKDITSRNLPQSVLEWVNEDFPGAKIDDASRVVNGSSIDYELLLAQKGQLEVEATLRMSEPSSGDVLVENHERVTFHPPTGSITAVAEILVPTDAVAAMPSKPPERAAARHEASAPASTKHMANGREPMGSWEARVVNGSPPLQATPPQGTPRTVGIDAPPNRMPEIAGALRNVVAADLSALTRELQQTLDLLAKNRILGSSSNRAAFGVAALSAFLAGIHLLRPERRTRLRNVSLSGNNDVSWTWIMRSPHDEQL